MKVVRRKVGKVTGSGVIDNKGKYQEKPAFRKLEINRKTGIFRCSTAAETKMCGTIIGCAAVGIRSKTIEESMEPHNNSLLGFKKSCVAVLKC